LTELDAFRAALRANREALRAARAQGLGAPVPVAPGVAKPGTDLAAIEEIGPAMRHRLARLGYRHCEDLAAADPAQLARQLGAASRMLRPERWIAAARDRLR
jgi:predicted flap endonuclease-1-like 5' DNA nuclease